MNPIDPPKLSAGRGSATNAALHLSPTKPAGTVTLSGAKNSALRLAVASLLSSEPVRLLQFPSGLLDVQVQLGMLEALGKKVTFGDDWVEIVEATAPPSELRWPDGRSIRNTLLVLGALLARRGAGAVPMPGGCDLGGRPYNYHQELFEALGAKVWVEDDLLHASHPGGQLSGGVYRCPIRSTGVTENALLCGALADGPVELVNPHLTPEVMDLVGFLRLAGVQVDVNGSYSIHISNSGPLRPGSWKVIADRIEGITWAAAAVVADGDIEIKGFPSLQTPVAVEYLEAAGARVFHGRDSLIVRSAGPQPLSFAAGAHPAVHSDMQPIFAAIGASSVGRTEIVDLRYPDRFGYIAEFQKLGIVGSAENGRAVIDGTGRVRSGVVGACDLRAGAALLVCALGAEGEVVIEDAWQILRGYDRLDEKLNALGISYYWK